MVRKLALAVSFALGTLSVPVHALGLGELNSRSTLNQNFNGEITLLSVQPEELDAVRVKLADADAFSRAGVDRPFFLSLLKFEPELTAKGRTVIQVTSEFPIREPFLNFLVEVNWPNGRLLREYTVLLDPPTTTTRRPPTVAPARQTRPAAGQRPARPSQPAAPTAAAVSGAAGSDYGPVQANETAWSIAKKVRPGGVSMAQMMIALLNANPDAFVDGNINRLRRGQILRVPALAEIQQLSRQAARQAYREQQDQWLARRNERLQSTETETAGEAAPEAAGPTTETQDQLRIATARPEGEGEPGAGDDDAAVTTPSDLKSRLIVARENAETSRQEAETLRSQVDDLQTRLQDMQKLLSLKDEQLAQLQDRVVTEEAAADAPAPAGEPQMPGGEAEAPDVVLANQVAAGDDAAADVGAAVDAAVADLTAETVPADGDYAIEDIAPRIDPDRIVEAGGIADSPFVEDVPVFEIPEQIDPDRIVEQAAGMAGSQVAESPSAMMDSAPPVDAEPTAEAPAVTEAPVESTETETMAAPASTAQPALAGMIPAPLLAMVKENIVPIALGGIAFLGLIGFVATRGGRRKEEDGPDAAAGPVAATAAAAASADSRGVDEPAFDAAALSDLPESALLDEFSPSEINALQDETGEVDPVSEADVYIAYGRYQQAEELLKQALEREPDRLALKHKLLEVYYATRNTAAFSTLAQEMVDAGQDTVDEVAWVRAQDMGRELSPDDALFALNEASSAESGDREGKVTASADEDTLSLDDLEISELTAAYEEEPDKSADDLEAPSEVSILLDTEDGSPAAGSADRKPDMPESISLDELDSLEFELPEAETAGSTIADSDSESLISDSFDLDSMMVEAEAAVDGGDSTLNLDSEFSADELQAQLDELSDLSVLDSKLDEPSEAAADQTPGNLGLVEEDATVPERTLDQPVDLDQAIDIEDAQIVSGEVLELDKDRSDADSAGDEDDVGTKLDLARAYVEMGDRDGALSILDEVLAEGNDDQRGDAEKLRAQLG